MKRLLIILFVGVVAGPSLFAREQTILARITVYWPGEGGERAFFNGAKLRSGHCAVDPKKIPFGSQVVFPDAACLAIDTGPAVVSRIAARKCAKTAAQRIAPVIDRYFETKKQALAWVASHPHFMTVRVLDPHHKTREPAQTAPVTATRDVAIQTAAPASEPIPSNSNSAASAPVDVRGPLLPTFVGTALPRS